MMNSSGNLIYARFLVDVHVSSMQVFQVVKEAKAKGFSDVLFLEAVEHKYIEEVSSCNAFIVKVMLCYVTSF